MSSPAVAQSAAAPRRPWLWPLLFAFSAGIGLGAAWLGGDPASPAPPAGRERESRAARALVFPPHPATLAAPEYDLISEYDFTTARDLLGWKPTGTFAWGRETKVTPRGAVVPADWPVDLERDLTAAEARATVIQLFVKTSRGGRLGVRFKAPNRPDLAVELGGSPPGETAENALWMPDLAICTKCALTMVVSPPSGEDFTIERIVFARANDAWAARRTFGDGAEARVRLGDETCLARPAPPGDAFDVPIPDGAGRRVEFGFGAATAETSPGRPLRFVVELAEPEPAAPRPLFAAVADLSARNFSRRVIRQTVAIPADAHPDASLRFRVAEFEAAPGVYFPPLAPREGPVAPAWGWTGPRWGFWTPAILKAAADAPADGRADVIVVSIEPLRADRLAAYGGTPGLTPALDGLAREAVVCGRAYTTANAPLPAHVSMFTGLLAGEHGVVSRGRRLAARQTVVPLARRLREAGYRTAAFVGGATLDADFGLDTGFERYSSTPDAGGGASVSFAAAGEWATRAAVTSRPFFLFAHTALPRPPHAPAEKFWKRHALAESAPAVPKATAAEIAALGDRPAPAPEPDAASRRIAALYDARVAAADEGLGLFLDRLRRAGLLDRAMLIVTAPHGVDLGEHTGLAGWHRHSLEENVIRVPLLVRLPAGAHGGERRRRAVSLAGLAATVLEELGIGEETPVAAARRRLLQWPLEADPPAAAPDSPEPWTTAECFVGDTRAGVAMVAGAQKIVGWRPARLRQWRAARPGTLWDRYVASLPELRLIDLARDPGERKDQPASPAARAEAERVLGGGVAPWEGRGAWEPLASRPALAAALRETDDE